MRLAILCAFAISVLASTPAFGDFRSDQLRSDRVRTALAEKGPALKALFAAKGVPYPPKGIFLRVFKLDRELELWAEGTNGVYQLVKTYAICAGSGRLGPKRREGDSQVPEGFYSIAAFNPYSNFHLSLGIDYPNASDRVRGKGNRLGGDIMIHGNCVTIGCVPITDPMIEEVYLAAMGARAAGQARIQAHFLPTRLNADGWAQLNSQGNGNAVLLAFWRELQPGYDAFEQTHRPPHITINGDGRYQVTQTGK